MSKGDDMISAAAIVAGILNLSEAEFFSADQATLAARESQLLDSDFSGIAVNAPANIQTDRRDRLPFIMATRCTGDRDWDVRMTDNCVLVGTNLRDGSVHFAQALVLEKELLSRSGRLRAPKGPKPEGLPSEAAQLTELDARGRLHIRWNTGTWSLGVISYDWPSNTVIVNLKGDEPVERVPARPVFPAPNPAGTKAKGDDTALPCYLPQSKTPHFPDSGVSFTAEYRVIQDRQQLNVFGTIVTRVRDFELPQQKIMHQFQDGQQEKVAAVIPVTFAVLALDWDVPLQFDWAVPVYGDELKPGTPAQGCFAIDALATGNTHSLAPGKYVCYIVMDGRIFGPQSLLVE